VNSSLTLHYAEFKCMSATDCASGPNNQVLTCDGDERCAGYGADEHCCVRGNATGFSTGTHCVRTKCPDGEVPVCPLGQKPDPCVSPASCTETRAPNAYAFCGP
jgi:hypothetical protein